LNKLDEIISLFQKHGRMGARVLFIFKLLKERVKGSFPSATIDEDALNRVCIQKAQELAKLGVEDIKKILSRLGA
jgi:hypothetical protein